MAQLTIVFGLVECVFGWLQLLGFAASGNSMYPATGTFYNPGPYCGFLAVITPVALHAVLRDRHRAAVWLSGTYLFLAIGLMPALMGRTGWIAALLGCAVVAAGRYVSAGRSFEKGRLRVYAVSVIVLTTAFLALLYFLKPDSAQGRVLMWMVAFKAMFAHPLGVGWDRVAGAFGQAQEDYFAQHPDSGFISVAGAPEYVFNRISAGRYRIRHRGLHSICRCCHSRSSGGVEITLSWSLRSSGGFRRSVFLLVSPPVCRVLSAGFSSRRSDNISSA